MGERSLPARKGREVRGTETLRVELKLRWWERPTLPSDLFGRRYSLRKRRESPILAVPAAADEAAGGRRESYRELGDRRPIRV